MLLAEPGGTAARLAPEPRRVQHPAACMQPAARAAAARSRSRRAEARGSGIRQQRSVQGRRPSVDIETTMAKTGRNDPCPAVVARNTSAAASTRTRPPSAPRSPPLHGDRPSMPRSPTASPTSIPTTMARTSSREHPMPPPISSTKANSTKPRKWLATCSNAFPTSTTAGTASAWSTKPGATIRRPPTAIARSVESRSDKCGPIDPSEA